MIRLVPFRGYRYDPAQSGPLADVVTQPYDKITPAMLESYLQKSPHNIARVIKNPDYGNAGEVFAQWIEQGILLQDALPSLYPYEQRFHFEGQEVSRLGVIGLVPLEAGENAVKGHERITTEAFQDRLQLIRRTESNDGLIFSLYSDPELTAERVLQEATSSLPPVADLEDEFGVRHRVWAVSDPTLVQAISRPLTGKQLYIADGHHRFQTALSFRDECLRAGWKPSAPESFDKRMMALFNLDNPAVKILPTHRAVKGIESFNTGTLLQRLQEHFEVSPQAGFEGLRESMKNSGRHLGVVLPHKFILLTLRSDPGNILSGQSKSGQELDVNLLQDGILEPILGVGRDRVASSNCLEYFRDASSMKQMIGEGHYQVGFLLNPTTLIQVRQIADEGSRMPPKSTDFFPKLLTGLVLMKMEISR